MKWIRILLIFTTIFLLCPGCIGIPGILKHKADSLNVELCVLKPIKKAAIIVPLFGVVSEKWAIDVEKALQNPQCSLVVLWIESPGGSVTETKLLTHKLIVFQKKYNKPVYVYSEKILASGAYWVASTFEKIIISPAGYAGSIGVYMERPDYSELYDKLGLKYYYIVSDSTKVMGNSAIPMKDWEREHWQWTINSAHIAFMSHIWTYRLTQLIDAYKFRNKMDVKTYQDTLLVASQFKQIANGILYSPKYALLAGLVDNVMYFDEFMRILQSSGFTTITIDGKVITEFYPSSDKENSEKKLKQEVWNHLQAKQK